MELLFTQALTAGDDVGDAVSADPPQHSRIDISDLKQGRHVRVSGIAIDVDHFSHPPVV